MDTQELVNPRVTKAMDPREAAYLALLASQAGKQFIALSLDDWKKDAHPTKGDFALAYEIASGVTRRALTLDFIAQKLSTEGRLRLRPKERALVRMGLYQIIFMDRIPCYAAVDESVKLAKKYCFKTFASFLNALLRNAFNGIPILPMQKTDYGLSIYYSYPREFVNLLIEEQGIEKAEEILKNGNTQPIVMARRRPGFEVVRLEDLLQIQQASHSTDYYIQNATPAHLMLQLSEGMTKEPKRFLDMCAAPGGKLLAAHDLYPKATIFANDISQNRLTVLQKNVEKYKLAVVISTMDGIQYSGEQLFDLVILDAPCSNSGVLNRRAEARWRLNDAHLNPLEKEQKSLLKKAIKLTKAGGEVWYITCSILDCENGTLIKTVAQEEGVKIRFQKLILPNNEGWDGGYACALVKPT